MKRFNSWKDIILLTLCVILKSCEGVPMYDEKMSRDREIVEVIVDLRVDYNDEPVPDYLKNALAQAITDDSTMNNMYAGSMGDPQLRRSIAKFYSKSIGRHLDWEEEVMTAVGGSEALTSAIRALSKPGQEWILIQPFFDRFRSAIEIAYCVPRYANLKPRALQDNCTATNWELDRAEMKSLINANTKGIIFNNPNNPLGKCYTREELDFIAQLAKDHQLLVISDEVHEFTADAIIKMASLPGMYERTLTIGSASKAFCVPGWRVGWIFGPADLIKEINDIHRKTVNFIPPAQQRAISTIFEDELVNFGSSRSYLGQNLARIKRKRDFIVQALRQAGMLPIIPYGGYCMLAMWSDQQVTNLHNKFPMKETLVESMFNITMIKALPVGKYYGNQDDDKISNALRFCYHKSNETLQNAAKKLLLLNEKLMSDSGMA